MNSKKPKREDEQISYATSKKNIQKFKLVFVGDQGVGKSSIINRFIKDSFDPTHNPTVVRLQLWDTAGQERFKSLIPGYLRDCQAALIVLDLTQTQSFQSLSRWLDFVKQSRGEDALIYIVANKCDLLEEKDQEELTKLRQKVKDEKYKFFEVSAKNGTNIEKAFMEMSCEMLSIQKKGGQSSQEGQKSKLVQIGIAVEAERESVKKEKHQVKSNKSIVLRDQKNQRLIKQKNCC